MKPNIDSQVSIMVEGRIEALDTPTNLKKQYGVESMNEGVFKIARNMRKI
jgi:ABC-2 type transport system ATP-binding protein